MKPYCYVDLSFPVDISEGNGPSSALLAVTLVNWSIAVSAPVAYKPNQDIKQLCKREHYLPSDKRPE